MSNEEQYAYGDWEIEGVSCPISSAGLDDRDWATSVAYDFDDKFRSLHDLDDDQGCTTAEKAIKAFQRLKARYKERAEDGEESDNRNKKKLDIVTSVIDSELKS